MRAWYRCEVAYEAPDDVLAAGPVSAAAEYLRGVDADTDLDHTVTVTRLVGDTSEPDGAPEVLRMCARVVWATVATGGGL